MNTTWTRRQFVQGWAAATAFCLLPAAKAKSAPALRVAVIGHTGRGNYGHDLDLAWAHLPETEVVGIADPDPAGLVKRRDRLKAKSSFNDYRKMLDETKPDIVVICPRHADQHCTMALAAIGAGARGIYLEKPFCRTLAEADAIVSACEKKQVMCAVAHRMPTHPVVPTVERLVKSGAIGRLLEVRGRGKEDERGGAVDLWVLGSHVLNLALVFTGVPVACSGMLFQGGRPATRADIFDGSDAVGKVAGNEVHARFETASHVPICFDSVRGAGLPAAGWGLQLIGTTGVINFRFDREPTAYLTAGNPFGSSVPNQISVPISTLGIGKPESNADIEMLYGHHVFAARDLLNAMERGERPRCNERDGRTIVEMVMAVFESHRLGGRRVPFPIMTRENPIEAM